MFSVGVDIVEISRFKNARYLKRVAEFFLTKKEISFAFKDARKYQHLASRFVVKEAVAKAMPEPIKFKEFEIIKHLEKPAVRFLKSKFNKYLVAVSLSHNYNSAIGFALVKYKTDQPPNYSNKIRWTKKFSKPKKAL